MDEIKRTVDELNRTWRNQRFEELGQFFDEHIVMKGPGFKDLVPGREALVQSYAKFMKQSKVTEFAESNHSIHSWGDTAAATYDWTISYEQDGQVHRDSGQEMFVFVRQGPRWVAVLRVMLVSS